MKLPIILLEPIIRLLDLEPIIRVIYSTQQVDTTRIILSNSVVVGNSSVSIGGQVGWTTLTMGASKEYRKIK